MRTTSGFGAGLVACVIMGGCTGDTGARSVLPETGGLGGVLNPAVEKC